MSISQSVDGGAIVILRFAFFRFVSIVAPRHATYVSMFRPGLVRILDGSLWDLRLGLRVRCSERGGSDLLAPADRSHRASWSSPLFRRAENRLSDELPAEELCYIDDA
jgi:hypothetical protein